MSTPSSSTQHIAILGAGVIGLTTGLALLESPSPLHKRSVTIVSANIPHSHHSKKQQLWHILNPTPSIGSIAGGGKETTKHPVTFASAWAGAHHVSDAKTAQEKRQDQQTFERMRQLVEKRLWSHLSDASVQAEPLVWVHQTEYFEAFKPDGSHPATGLLDWYPDYKILPQSALPPGTAAGCTLRTLDINVPVYLGWLLSRFLQLGGRVVHRSVSSVEEALRVASSPSTDATGKSTHGGNFGPVDLLLVSPGLGARTLKGLEDEAVHPHRGQVVLVTAPWLATSSSVGRTSKGAGSGGGQDLLPGYSIVKRQGGRETYTIPRGDGTVVCGGTRIVDDWSAAVRPETTRAILQRCLKVCPQLARPDRTLPHLDGPKVEDVEVLGVNVGLRPARKGGIRLERGTSVNGVKVVYSYGYGGWGYQASWGAAYEVRELIDKALSSSTSYLAVSKL